MGDSVQIGEGGNYGNAGLSIKGHGQGLSNLMSYCLENQNNMPNETALVQWGLKNKEWVDFCHCVHTLPTRIYVQTPCKSDFA